MIRIDCAWLAIQPLDMRAGPDTALARVVKVFGAAHPHHTYVEADMTMKERALAAIAAPQTPKGNRYRPPDDLLKFLESL